MPIPELNQEHGNALIEETTAITNLLGYGTRILRTTQFNDTTRDPILTLLSIGTEKLYKVTLGLIALADTGKWMSRDTAMNDYGHQVLKLHEATWKELRTRAASSNPYLRRLIAEVAADPVIPPLIETLERYGRSGRFYDIDALGGKAQQWEPPRDYWDRAETAARNDPDVLAAYTAAMDDVSATDLWDGFYFAQRDRIARSVERLWGTVAACATHRLLGEVGARIGHALDPSMADRT